MSEIFEPTSPRRANNEDIWEGTLQQIMRYITLVTANVLQATTTTIYYSFIY